MSANSEISDDGQKRSIFFYISRAFLFLIVSLLLLITFKFEEIFLAQPPDLNSIGIIKQKDGMVRIKKPGNPNWVALSENDFIPKDSLVFSSKASTATYILLDGTVINQTEETLLRMDMKIKSIDPFQTKISLVLNKGTIQVKTPATLEEDQIRELRLNSQRMKTARDQKTEMQLDKEKDETSFDIAVISGKVEVDRNKSESIEINEGEQIKGFTQEKIESQRTSEIKTQVPEKLLEQYKKEAENALNEDYQNDLMESRSFARIIERILDGLF